ncbi:glutaminase-domain-containing protein [Rhizoclosmatium globosum]|uniref:glutaminase n=1 Tax=Rhizoclosmatium globosum TaxID=329046 RepID=A0A1Y2CL61_9FUNG|nr:glutaminase-domain-containing protein [Rhizoclosmatium globosum]|eukprot:ORY47769.1 glutaminase-domain-containing protein [Rhizoclosmatium globosum]
MDRFERPRTECHYLNILRLCIHQLGHDASSVNVYGINQYSCNGSSRPENPFRQCPLKDSLSKVDNILSVFLPDNIHPTASEGSLGRKRDEKPHHTTFQKDASLFGIPVMHDIHDLQDSLILSGFLPDDPRFQEIFAIKPTTSPESPRLQKRVGHAEEVVTRALQGTLAIPDFQRFKQGVKEIFEQVREKELGGSVAKYIPQLASVDPNLFAVSFCSIDGQRFNLGDADVDFSIQSCSKPITYSIALEEQGAAKVHSHVGKEPSGQSFNHMSLLVKRKLPHNPMINAGAIMTSSLIQVGMPLYKRFGKVTEIWSELFGGKKVGFNNSVYLSEKDTADRNYALAYMMKEAGAFPENTNLYESLEFYFQCCSLEASTDKMAILAATYANGGICPITNTHVFDPSTVRNCISLMASCGMYDYSGEWNFQVGLPAKSGVGGAIWVVVPNVGGFCCYSPPVDELGNSTKGLEFFKMLSERYAFHMMEPQRLRGLKMDPTTRGEKE